MTRLATNSHLEPQKTSCQSSRKLTTRDYLEHIISAKGANSSIIGINLGFKVEISNSLGSNCSTFQKKLKFFSTFRTDKPLLVSGKSHVVYQTNSRSAFK